MKIKILLLIIVLFGFISNTKALDEGPAIKEEYKPEVEGQLLKDPLRLLMLHKEKVILFRLKFVLSKQPGQESSKELQNFNIKTIQFNKDNIVIYHADQNSAELNESSVNASLYVATLRYADMDLPCDNNQLLCSVNELMTQYGPKLKGEVEFKLNQDVINDMTEQNALNQCIAISMGAFTSLDEVAYLCAQTTSDYIFFHNLLSERILEVQKNHYDGQLLMVNEVISFI